VRLSRAMTTPAAVVLIAALSACGSTAGPASSKPATNDGSINVADFDGPDYKTVDDLDAAADVVVRGTVTRVRTTTTEEQLQRADAEAATLPLSLYELSTTEFLSGSAAPTILVTRIDTSRLATDAQTPFEPGSEVVLFLRDTKYDWEGTDVYSVVGMDQGFFKVESGKLRGMQKEGTPAAAGMTVAEIAQQVR
jgi:hypothetical protein